MFFLRANKRGIAFPGVCRRRGWLGLPTAVGEQPRWDTVATARWKRATTTSENAKPRSPFANCIFIPYT